jgi:uncharacterized protein with ATP-grasp and redox domains
MKTFLDCIPCFFRQSLDAARLVTDDPSIHEQILRNAFDVIKELDLHQTPPAMAQQIHRRIRQLMENPDPYRELKKQYNTLAMDIYSSLEATVHSSDDSIENAVRLAIAGNIIDLGVKTSVSIEDIHKTINDSLTASIDASAITKFKTDIENARDILYLADNAGEIVFDRLLIEQLPTEKVTVAVKGFPIINDATLLDAAETGLTDIVNVIDNGSDAPGTILETCSKDFVIRFEQADLVIAKGQGNYETLSDVKKPIYFLLKAKCPVVAADLCCEIGNMIIHKNEIQETIPIK